MSNIVPANEGWLTEAQWTGLRNEIRDVVVPLLDGTNLTEGLTLGPEVFEVVMEVKSLPEMDARKRAFTILSALSDVLNEIQKDLVIMYADEV